MFLTTPVIQQQTAATGSKQAAVCFNSIDGRLRAKCFHIFPAPISVHTHEPIAVSADLPSEDHDEVDSDYGANTDVESVTAAIEYSLTSHFAETDCTSSGFGSTAPAETVNIAAIWNTITNGTSSASASSCEPCAPRTPPSRSPRRKRLRCEGPKATPAKSHKEAGGVPTAMGGSSAVPQRQG